MNESALLLWLILLPVAGGVAVWGMPVQKNRMVRRAAIGFALATFLLSILAARKFHWAPAPASYDHSAQLITDTLLLPGLNIHFLLGADALSLTLLLLTTFLCLVACWASYGIEKNLKGYFALLLFLEAGFLGALSALDLVLFCFFFQAALVPLCFLIGRWGGPRREFAAVKTLLFFLPGAAAMLLVILGLHAFTPRAVGHDEFNLLKLPTDPQFAALFAPVSHQSAVVQPASTTPTVAAVPAPQFLGMTPSGFAPVAFWLLFLAFGLALPVAPLHLYLSDAQAEAPTAVSMLLASLVPTLGAYGLLRVAYPLFPHYAALYGKCLAPLALGSIFFAALCALRQRDLKRLVAFASVSQMGFVVLGISVLTPAALQGAFIATVSHALVFAMIFFGIGVIEDRARHREIPRLGGLKSQMPEFSGWVLVAILAALGLPGLCGFVGQLLIVLGIFAGAAPDSALSVAGTYPYQTILWALAAAAAMISTAAYLLSAWHRVFLGPPRAENSHFPPATRREILILATLALPIVALGLFPNQLLFTPLKVAIENLSAVMGIRN